MEFFRIVEVGTTEESIKRLLKLDKIENMSNQLFQLAEASGREVSIGSIWGEFTLTCDLINGGLRFALVECPNALTWTITTGFAPAREAIVIHLTINRKQKQQQFIDEIEEFLDDQMLCLQNIFSGDSPS
ncbi:MAG: hypothetical protein HQ521_13835 [Bacteroidetes bacterium]|nr:hypothetical protein [Bacteroidota bacterium]